MLESPKESMYLKEWNLLETEQAGFTEFCFYFFKKIGLGWVKKKREFQSTLKEVKVWSIAICLIFVICTCLWFSRYSFILFYICQNYKLYLWCILLFFHYIESCLDWRCAVCAIHPSSHAAVICFCCGLWQYGRVEWENIIY